MPRRLRQEDKDLKSWPRVSETLTQKEKKKVEGRKGGGEERGEEGKERQTEKKTKQQKQPLEPALATLGPDPHPIPQCTFCLYLSPLSLDLLAFLPISLLPQISLATLRPDTPTPQSEKEVHL